MPQQTINPPKLIDLLREHKEEIFAELNCIQIGRITSYNKDQQTVEVQIQVKRRVTKTEIVDYPLLIDCPVIYLQGGGAYIDLPIAAGDYALLLFNDRDINAWWDTGTVKEPDSTRKHSLSDAFAIVGINPKTQVLGLDGSSLKIWGPGASDNIEITDAGAINIGTGGPAAAREDDPTISTITEDSTWWAFVTAFFGVITGAPINEPGAGNPSALQAALAAAITATGGVPSEINGKINGGSSEVTIK
jgi:hypothetical protein